VWAWTHYAKPVFFHPVGSAGYVVHFDAFGSRSIDVIFFMLRWARCGLHKKHPRTNYTKPVFLHLVGSAGHVVHSSASGACVTPNFYRNKILST
jgi:hypothetical protein